MCKIYKNRLLNTVDLYEKMVYMHILIDANALQCYDTFTDSGANALMEGI